MTRTNRTLNRVLLLLVGLGCLVLAVILAAPLAPAAWRDLPVARLIPTVPEVLDPTVLWAVAGIAVAVIVFCIVWIATRGRGRTSRAYDADGVILDDRVVEGLLRAHLADQPDVLAVGSQAFQRGDGTVLTRVEVRARADLPALLTRLRAAVAHTDTTLGTTLPMVLHVTTGIRTATTGSRTTR